VDWLINILLNILSSLFYDGIKSIFGFSVRHMKNVPPKSSPPKPEKPTSDVELEKRRRNNQERLRSLGYATAMPLFVIIMLFATTWVLSTGKILLNFPKTIEVLDNTRVGFIEGLSLFQFSFACTLIGFLPVLFISQIISYKVSNLLHFNLTKISRRDYLRIFVISAILVIAPIVGLLAYILYPSLNFAGIFSVAGFFLLFFLASTVSSQQRY
jgi:hypothetical protein